MTLADAGILLALLPVYALSWWVAYRVALWLLDRTVGRG